VGPGSHPSLGKKGHKKKTCGKERQAKWGGRGRKGGQGDSDHALDRTLSCGTTRGKRRKSDGKEGVCVYTPQVVEHTQCGEGAEEQTEQRLGKKRDRFLQNSRTFGRASSSRAERRGSVGQGKKGEVKKGGEDSASSQYPREN